jgi:asparagine synthase (glutamine-hydrolysing)
MCGIAGLADFSGAAPTREMALAMVQRVRHRGPDFQDATAIGVAALGHARLSIIDLSDAGRQPMSTADGRYTIVYNGEVYNFPDLRIELESRGVTFRGKSDTEVVLQAFALWGIASLRRLNGIFAFAIWDRDAERLFLVRDRFGVKPLYYRLGAKERISFGSESKSVLADLSATGAIDWQALHELMYYGAGGLGPRTLLSSVRKLEAGQVLAFDRDGVRLENYWQFDPVTMRSESDIDLVDRIRGLLEVAVKRQLISDVPVGVFLSGGIDSSAVTAFASRHYGRGLKTYSVGFDFAGDSNELPKAAAVAKHFGTEHHELFVKGADLPSVVEALVLSHDDAFSDAANIPLYLLCKEMGGDLRVVLQGDGGDELFGGYRRYMLLARERRMRLAASVGKLACSLPLGQVRGRRVSRMVDIWLESDATVRMALLMAQDERKPSPLRVLGAEARICAEKQDPFARYREVGQRFSGVDAVQRMLWTDMQILLPDIFLEKVDKSTMAWGVEARVPFLDHDLAEYVMGLSAAVKLEGGQPKGLLKRALRGVVPDFVLDAPKLGFGVPYGRWLQGPLAAFAREKIAAGRAAKDGLLDGAQTVQLLEEHMSGRDDHGFLLWKTLNLALWYERYQPRLDSNNS